MKPLHYILFLSLLFLVFSCGKEKTTNEAARTEASDTRIVLSKEQFTTSGFTLDTLKERPFPTLIEVTGMMDVPPQNKAIVTTTVGGFVKTTTLLIGDEVKKGQALLTLEHPDYVRMQQEYLEVYKQLDFLKSEYERQKTLYDENITSQKNYLKAQSTYETALATYNGLKQQLQMLNISPLRVEQGEITPTITLYASISGSITKMNISKGSFVSPSTEVLEIVDNDHMHLELTVYEKDILKVRKGQKILFKIPEASTETFTAEVHLVGTSLEQDTRSIRVHGHMEDEENHSFLVGMFVEANIVANSSAQPSLTESAVVMVDKQPVALQLVEETDTDYVFEKVYPKLQATREGFTVLGLEMGTPPTVFLGKGAFHLLAEE